MKPRISIPTVVVALVAGAIFPVLALLPASAAAKSGQLCAKSAENAQVAGLTCTKDSAGKLRWSSAQVPVAAAPTVPKTSPKDTTKQVATTKINATTKAKAATAAQTATTAKPSTKTTKQKTAAVSTPPTTAVRKGRFCKKAAIGQTAKDPSGAALKCTANPNGGTPQWSAA